MKVQAMISLLALLFVMNAGAQEVTQQAATQQVFIYSPNERAGLHIAQQTAKGWQDNSALRTTAHGARRNVCIILRSVAPRTAHGDSYSRSMTAVRCSLLPIRRTSSPGALRTIL